MGLQHDPFLSWKLEAPLSPFRAPGGDSMGMRHIPRASSLSANPGLLSAGPICLSGSLSSSSSVVHFPDALQFRRKCLAMVGSCLHFHLGKPLAGSPPPPFLPPNTARTSMPSVPPCRIMCVSHFPRAPRLHVTNHPSIHPSIPSIIYLPNKPASGIRKTVSMHDPCHQPLRAWREER